LRQEFYGVRTVLKSSDTPNLKFMDIKNLSLAHRSPFKYGLYDYKTVTYLKHGCFIDRTDWRRSVFCEPVLLTDDVKIWYV
jgi:hypothetical protein